MRRESRCPNMRCRWYSATRYGLGSMTHVLLVRHGESEWNALGRWQGQADPPLSDHGRRQARLAAQSIGAVDAIFASRLERAQSTAALIGDVLGIGPVIVDERLIERDAGEWSGLTRAEINEAWPGYLAADPDNRAAERRPPGWEPDASLLARAFPSLHDIAAAVDGGTAVAVTHGGVIYAIEAHLGAPRRYLPNLGSRWLIVEDGGIRLGDRIHLYDPDNDPGHPDETVPDASAV